MIWLFIPGLMGWPDVELAARRPVGGRPSPPPRRRGCATRSPLGFPVAPVWTPASVAAGVCTGPAPSWLASLFADIRRTVLAAARHGFFASIFSRAFSSSASFDSLRPAPPAAPPPEPEGFAPCALACRCVRQRESAPGPGPARRRSSGQEGGGRDGGRSAPAAGWPGESPGGETGPGRGGGRGAGEQEAEHSRCYPPAAAAPGPPCSPCLHPSWAPETKTLARGSASSLYAQDRVTRSHARSHPPRARGRLRPGEKPGLRARICPEAPLTWCIPHPPHLTLRETLRSDHAHTLPRPADAAGVRGGLATGTTS